jgi:hypothetical protein
MMTNVDEMFGDEYEPVVQNGRIYLRKKREALRAAQSQFDECVRLAMQGRTYADRAAVQRALAQTAKSCAHLE